MNTSDPDTRSTSAWGRIPQQVKRLSVVLVLLIIIIFTAQHFLVPPDFGEHGHFRTAAVTDIISLEANYAGHEVCNDCHDDIVDTRNSGYHKNVSCEVCHGPAAVHAEDPGTVELRAPRGRAECPLCHEYLPSRPTGFPQIISASHNPMKPCISCHNPHDPKPPETPKQCEACHATIAKTKSLSHHVYVPCERCHEAPTAHKINPRQNRPSIPQTREFCGECHGEDAVSEKGIPRVDLGEHYVRYVCWQCHYPHLPEAQ